MKSIEWERSVAIALDAEVFGIAKAASMHSVSQSTAKRRVAEMKTDPKFAQAVLELKQRTIAPVRINAQQTLDRCLEWFNESLSVIDKKDSESILRVFSAYKIIAELTLATRVVELKTEKMQEPH
jgi:hypothetical protein